MIYFTSDTHFGHKRIIEICRGKFSSVEEMNEAIIKNWNSCVSDNDEVYHLGDFFFCGNTEAIKIMDRLNGKIHLIKGNHDGKYNQELKSKFVWIKDYYKLKLDGLKIILSHYPIRSWDQQGKGSFHLYGHCHGNLPEDKSLSFDVGVDCSEFFPISIDCVKSVMKAKYDMHGIVTQDHHN